jgi:hypothetical protein
VIGPSWVGKSHLIVSLILNIYRNCFERIYIYNPSIHVDEIWKPVKEYIKDHIQLEPGEDVYFDHYDPSSLQYITDTQHNIIYYMKTKNYKQLFFLNISKQSFETKLPPQEQVWKWFFKLHCVLRMRLLNAVAFSKKYSIIFSYANLT